MNAEILDIIQDQLEGIRIRTAPATPKKFAPPEEGLVIPFAVMAYDDGMDYDGDGNAYWDDYPSWFVSSAHKDRHSAEVAMAYAEDRFPNGRYHIEENHWVPDWEIPYLRWE